MVEICPREVYNMHRDKNKGVVDMDTVKVKPIRQTIITDEKIIKEVINQATKKPTHQAMQKNISALQMLRKFRG